ncbi:hypothetical protein HYU95_04200 [Candidatus Daviesbacteria bacterium]|nr:hypothetical protein [Candidatus Daviesbacteria bacterium]
MFSRGTGWFFTKDIPDNSKGNYAQESGNLSLSNLWCKINHASSAKLSALTANCQNSIAATTLNVNTKGSRVTSIAAIQPATKLEQSAENTFIWALLGSKENFIQNYFSKRKAG